MEQKKYQHDMQHIKKLIKTLIETDEQLITQQITSASCRLKEIIVLLCKNNFYNKQKKSLKISVSDISILAGFSQDIVLYCMVDFENLNIIKIIHNNVMLIIDINKVMYNHLVKKETINIITNFENKYFCNIKNEIKDIQNYETSMFN